MHIIYVYILDIITYNIHICVYMFVYICIYKYIYIYICIYVYIIHLIYIGMANYCNYCNSSNTCLRFDTLRKFPKRVSLLFCIFQVSLLLRKSFHIIIDYNNLQ